MATLNLPADAQVIYWGPSAFSEIRNIFLELERNDITQIYERVVAREINVDPARHGHCVYEVRSTQGAIFVRFTEQKVQFGLSRF